MDPACQQDVMPTGDDSIMVCGGYFVVWKDYFSKTGGLILTGVIYEYFHPFMHSINTTYSETCLGGYGYCLLTTCFQVHPSASVAS